MINRYYDKQALESSFGGFQGSTPFMFDGSIPGQAGRVMPVRHGTVETVRNIFNASPDKVKSILKKYPVVSGALGIASFAGLGYGAAALADRYASDRTAGYTTGNPYIDKHAISQGMLFWKGLKRPFKEFTTNRMNIASGAWKRMEEVRNQKLRGMADAAGRFGIRPDVKYLKEVIPPGIQDIRALRNIQNVPSYFSALKQSYQASPTAYRAGMLAVPAAPVAAYGLYRGADATIDASEKYKNRRLGFVFGGAGGAALGAGLGYYLGDGLSAGLGAGAGLIGGGLLGLGLGGGDALAAYGQDYPYLDKRAEMDPYTLGAGTSAGLTGVILGSFGHSAARQLNLPAKQRVALTALGAVGGGLFGAGSGALGTWGGGAIGDRFGRGWGTLAGYGLGGVGGALGAYKNAGYNQGNPYLDKTAVSQALYNSAVKKRLMKQLMGYGTNPSRTVNLPVIQNNMKNTILRNRDMSALRAITSGPVTGQEGYSGLFRNINIRNNAARNTGNLTAEALREMPWYMRPLAMVS